MSELLDIILTDLKKKLQGNITIDGNSDYSDWEALIKFNRSEDTGAFGPEDMVNDYIDTIINNQIDNLNTVSLRELNEEAFEDSNVSLIYEREIQMDEKAIPNLIYIDAISYFIKSQINKLIYEEAGSEEWFDKYDHEASDILNQMQFRVEKLKKHADPDVTKMAEELNEFIELMWEQL